MYDTTMLRDGLMMETAPLLTAISIHFESWRRRQARLSRDLRDLPYLLSPPKPPTVM